MAGKILFLHGYTQSGPSFANKSSGLRKALKKHGFSAHYPTAPIPLLVTPDMPVEEQERLRSLGYKETDSYAWFVQNDATGEYDGIDKSWKVLHDYIEAEGPFLGVVGFSQGAVIAAVLCARVKFKFAVLFSGFKSKLKEHDQCFPLTIPTLHITGKNDVIVLPERSQSLVDACVNSTVYQHPGGHFVPSNREVVTFVIDWIEKVTAENEQSSE